MYITYLCKSQETASKEYVASSDERTMGFEKYHYDGVFFRKIHSRRSCVIFSLFIESNALDESIN